MAAALAGGAQITVPVRRPIAYIAGTVSRAPNNDASKPLVWTEVPATVADLSTGGALDGHVVLAGNAVMMIAAGPNLYMVTQAVNAMTGALTGNAQILPVSTSRSLRRRGTGGNADRLRWSMAPDPTTARRW